MSQNFTQTSPLRQANVVITGASMGIGRSIALALARQGANLVLLSRSDDRLAAVAEEIHKENGSASKVLHSSVDVRDPTQISDAIKDAVSQLGGPIDVLVNNAGLAVGAPKPFPDLSVDEIDTMADTNVKGFMYAAYAALNAGGMMERKKGTILNITSVTGLEVPPFPGEAVYHSSKAFQEAFTNVLRTELQETNIKVLALRPGVVATNFHEQRVGYEKGQYDDFMAGFEPLLAEDVAQSAVWILQQDERISVKALDVVPTAQRTLQVIDKTWNERNGKGNEEMKE